MHELYADREVVAAVTDRWSVEVAPGGVVDRSAVARHAFADAAERQWLEALLWPRVRDRTAAWRAEREAAAAASPVTAPRALVVEVPLLFEGGLEDRFDATLAVVADEATRRQRAAARGHAAVDERAARQLSQAEKAARATFVVENAGSLEDLRRALSAVLEKLTA